MCEYCGCQAIATIDELTREHDFVVDLIGDVRTADRAGDRPRMADLAREISVALQPHTQVEEHGLFPAMAGDFPEQIRELEEQHRQIEAVLAETDALPAGAAPADPAWPGRLLDVLAVLRGHILAEQDGVFPAALIGLSTEQWESVEAVRRRVGGIRTGAPETAA